MPGIMRGKKHTEATKQKISKSMKIVVMNNPESYCGSNRGRSKQIIVDEIKFTGQWEVDFYLWAKKNNLNAVRVTTPFKQRDSKVTFSPSANNRSISWRQCSAAGGGYGSGNNQSDTGTFIDNSAASSPSAAAVPLPPSNPAVISSNSPTAADGSIASGTATPTTSTDNSYLYTSGSQRSSDVAQTSRDSGAAPVTGSASAPGTGGQTGAQATPGGSSQTGQGAASC